ncbi:MULTISPECIES: hypothetical protein [Halocynthiibacter]|uniref:Secreted protein n=1 Tax=Halocynthiibacter halioticoli TaxID=2986804 RepID=A0AAE3LTV6_9RHOB|nr:MULTISPECIES: hypothetical protein [Halocynthiibacter]MCV6825836.1 hypothetical protein [Halocynthiibacter halioticoli]MCW4058837.1 hypothetical protein [Halocynthiibacter sp. SDUM655004]
MKPLGLTALMVIASSLTACTPSSMDQPQISEPDPELNFVRPYRGAGDTCQLVGENAFTVDFLDDAADLVACSTGTDDSASLAASEAARVVTQTNSYTLYSVARR